VTDRPEDRRGGDAPPASLVGTSIGPYRLLEKLGEGGMGAVYLAEHTAIGRKAVIKVLHPQYAQRPEIAQRFKNEARAANEVDHEDIVEVYDIGKTADGAPYIVMEYLKGRTLQELLRDDGVQPEPIVRAIGLRLARALAAAHAKGIIHRDLKPANVFLTPQPGVPNAARVKVLDFGIAKLVEARLEPGVQTRTEAMLGTPSYMSPEQCEGARNVDARSDIYALGVMLYELLVGRLPFEADSLGGMLKKQMFASPDPPRTLDPRIGEDMERIVLRCLEKQPAARFQTMDELQAALGSAGAEASIPFVDTHSGTTKMPPMPAPTSPPLPRAVAGRVSPTTLRASAAEVSSGSSPPKGPGGRRGLMLALLGVPVFVAGAVAVYLVGDRLFPDEPDRRPVAKPIASEGDESDAPPERDLGKRTPPKPSTSAPTPDGVTPEAASAAVAAASPTGAPTARTVVLRLESVPSRADVIELPSGNHLGETPYEIEVPVGAPRPHLRLTLRGYAPTEVALATDRSDTTVMKLRAVKASRPPLPVPKVKPID
jgi:serine/threonine-protein kinase